MATKFSEDTKVGLDANSIGATTDNFNIKENTIVTMQVIANTGGNTTHIIDLQCSTNGTNWHNVSSGSVNQLGITGALTVGTKFVRGRVSTTEGGASTVDVIIQAK